MDKSSEKRKQATGILAPESYKKEEQYDGHGVHSDDLHGYAQAVNDFLADPYSN
ncbi:hypothetical protein C7820_5566 [Paenibacillus sp. VMFN-D1]|nr:hypothetical protein C7820_5566 [Paenibacillus sp. VMFN-D1]